MVVVERVVVVLMVVVVTGMVETIALGWIWEKIKVLSIYVCVK